MIEKYASDLTPGDEIIKGIFGDCTVVKVEDDDIKGTYSRVYYTRDTDFVHSFSTVKTNSFVVK